VAVRLAVRDAVPVDVKDGVGDREAVALDVIELVALLVALAVLVTVAEWVEVAVEVADEVGVVEAVAVLVEL
jgi:hypothetical protein